MAYIEVRTINGRKYKYLRHSIRKGNKVIHKTIKYLGPVDPMYKPRKKKPGRKK